MTNSDSALISCTDLNLNAIFFCCMNLIDPLHCESFSARMIQQCWVDTDFDFCQCFFFFFSCTFVSCPFCLLTNQFDFFAEPFLRRFFFFFFFFRQIHLYVLVVVNISCCNAADNNTFWFWWIYFYFLLPFSRFCKWLVEQKLNSRYREKKTKTNHFISCSKLIFD